LEIKIYSIQRVKEGREDKEGRTYRVKTPPNAFSQRLMHTC
jgi:hypothetical protein